jgi:hypothetical protein
MTKNFATPADLASTIFKKLRNTRIIAKPPEQELLNELFYRLFYTSLKTEEGQFIKVTVTFLDPNDAAKTSGKAAWRYIPFDLPEPCAVKSLTKLSKAADPWSSSLVVYPNDQGELYIWGMIDQAIHFQSFLHYEGNENIKQPGLFQASITKIGCLTVMFNYELLATLKHDVLMTNYVDVMQHGPVSELLDDFFSSVRRKVIENVDKDDLVSMKEYWEIRTCTLCKQTLSRLLLRIQNYQHGGAVLITERSETNLKTKHKINYARIPELTTKLLLENMEGETNSNELFFLQTSGDKNVPDYLHTKIVNSTTAAAKIESEIKGAIRFAASLSCIDGCVVMNSNLEVKGFGAIISGIKPPDSVYVSQKANVLALKMTPSDQLGTRHRSMFAYCWKHPGSLGFVISQDGDIRAVTRIEDKLIMWENIQVQQLIKSRKLRFPSILFKMRK